MYTQAFWVDIINKVYFFFLLACPIVVSVIKHRFICFWGYLYSRGLEGIHRPLQTSNVPYNIIRGHWWYRMVTHRFLYSWPLPSYPLSTKKHIYIPYLPINFVNNLNLLIIKQLIVFKNYIPKKCPIFVWTAWPRWFPLSAQVLVYHYVRS